MKINPYKTTGIQDVDFGDFPSLFEFLQGILLGITFACITLFLFFFLVSVVDTFIDILIATS